MRGVLTRANLQLNMCRCQAYDGAANMQGIRNGVATQIQAEAGTFSYPRPLSSALFLSLLLLMLCTSDNMRDVCVKRKSQPIRVRKPDSFVQPLLLRLSNGHRGQRWSWWPEQTTTYS